MNSDFNIGRNFSLTKTNTQDTVISSNRTLDVVGDIDFDLPGTFIINGGASVEADGDITITSNAVNIDSTAQIRSGSGTSNLTFLESGEDDAMELGGTGAGHTWQMEQSEIATIQDGFSSITFGSTSHAEDIYFSDDVSFSDDVIFRQDQTLGTNAIWGVDGLTFTTAGGADASFYNGEEVTAWDLALFNIAGDALFHNFNDLGLNHSTFGGDLTISVDDDLFLHSSANVTVGGDFTVSAIDEYQMGFSNSSTIQVDGDLSITSNRVALFTGSSISGNADGSSTLTFLEMGNTGNMEIGGTVNAYTWSMDDDELAAIQNGFSSITFGSSASTGNFSIQSADFSALSADMNFLANDMNIDGLTLGNGDVLIHVIDNGGDIGDFILVDNITRTQDGVSTLDIRADGNIQLLADIISNDTNSDADANPATSADSLNVILNADRNADQDGAISMGNITITTLGGDFTAGGGADPTTTAAYAAQDGAYDIGVELNNTDITTGAGNISIRGVGDDTGSNNYGVYIHSGSTLDATTGSITIAGTGGDGASSNRGVYLEGAGSIITSVDGNITITGAGGNGTIDGNVGIYLEDNAAVSSTGVASGGGAIALNGTGGSGVNNNSGVLLRTGGNITSAATGISAQGITVTGVAGNGTGSGNKGVDIQNNSGDKITSVDGDIIIDGTGNGVGGDGVGVRINHGYVQTTGTGDDAGTITITGIGSSGGGNQNYGVVSERWSSAFQVQTVDGDITITGTGGSNAGIDNHGIYLQDGNNAGATIFESIGDGNMVLTATSGPDASAIDLYLENTTNGSGLGDAAMTGNLTINADSVSIDGTIETTGTVSFHQRTDGTSIGISTGAGGLSISDPELASIIAGKLVIGDDAATSSSLFVNSWDLNARSYDVELYARSIQFNGLTLGAGDVTAIADDDITVNTAIGNNAKGGDVYLVAGDEFINNVGANAIDPGTGRFLIYAASPLKVTKNSLSATELYERTFALNPPASLGASSAYVFASDTPVVVSSNIRDALTPSVEQQIFTPPSIHSSTQLIYKASGGSNGNGGDLSEVNGDGSTPMAVQQQFLQEIHTPSSEADASVRLVEAQLMDVEKKIVNFYDLCSYNSLYCK